MTDWRDRIRNPDCELCPLHEGAQHVCLMGAGPRRTELMIVGEAPGAREDDEHRAFVGPSGKLLDKVLRDITGIERDACYVTNVVKCRPPDNRTPELKEMRTCADAYLWKEIEAVKPRFMLLLGNAALKTVTGKTGITKHHGAVFNLDGITVMATVHPALVLRNPSWAQAFGMDLQRLGRMMRGESTSTKTRVGLVRTKAALKRVREVLMQAKVISVDIETYVRPAEPPYVHTNFMEWHGDDSMIVTISFSVRTGVSMVVPLWHADTPWSDPGVVLRYLRPALERDDVIIVGHNVKFDARWFHEKGVRVRQGFDSMLSGHMLEENRSKGLKNRSRSELGADAYDVGEELKNAYSMDLRRIAIYNGKDTDYALRLAKRDRKLLAEDERLYRVFRRLMMPAANALVDVERTGVYLDPERWRERHDKAVDNRDLLYRYIDRWVPADMSPINLNSPQQVGRFLFDRLGLPVIERTAKGAPSTREAVLLRLASQHKAATAMIKYRKWAKYLSTYLLPWWYEHRAPDGRIRSTYKLFGTVTGRLSGEGGIHQVPRDVFIRSILGAAPGWVFVQADYSQIELRIAAMIANEKRMLRQYLMGEDIHMIRALRMTGKPSAEEVTKEERKKAKAVNFGYIYSMGAKKFVDYAFENYDLVITLEEAQRDRERFFEDYPALRPWHDRQRRLAQRYQRVVSPIGRVRHLPNIMSSDEDVRADAERQAINSPVQSLASDLMLFSLIRLHKALPPSEARIVGTVHDSILFEVREGMEDDYCPLIKQTMEDMDAVERVFKANITVPIVADVEVGTHWGEGTPWH